ncbi:hypothetical protein D3C87_1314740 [compost metagenome]
MRSTRMFRSCRSAGNSTTPTACISSNWCATRVRRSISARSCRLSGSSGKRSALIRAIAIGVLNSCAASARKRLRRLYPSSSLESATLKAFTRGMISLGTLERLIRADRFSKLMDCAWLTVSMRPPSERPTALGVTINVAIPVRISMGTTAIRMTKPTPGKTVSQRISPLASFSRSNCILIHRLRPSFGTPLSVPAMNCSRPAGVLRFSMVARTVSPASRRALSMLDGKTAAKAGTGISPYRRTISSASRTKNQRFG